MFDLLDRSTASRLPLKFVPVLTWGSYCIGLVNYYAM